MSGYKLVTGNLAAPGSVRLGIVASRFNDFIVEQLLRGCLETLAMHGIDASAVTVVKVPGAFELPLAAQRMAQSCDAVIALGAVIRGATPHFDLVANACGKGLADVSLQADVPVTMGVLTCDSIEQAIERAGTKAGNKGAEAAVTCLEMLSVMRQIT